MPEDGEIESSTVSLVMASVPPLVSLKTTSNDPIPPAMAAESRTRITRSARAGEVAAPRKIRPAGREAITAARVGRGAGLEIRDISSSEISEAPRRQPTYYRRNLKAKDSGVEPVTKD
jgi:hypothetical protein